MNFVADIFTTSFSQFEDDIAIVEEDKEISYRELFDSVISLTNRLRFANAKQGDIVGVFLEKSSYQIVSILSLFYCGLIYVPLNVEWPLERLKFVCNDCDMKYIITDRENSISPNLEIIKITELKANFCICNPCAYLPEDTAYIMYTSGSTGKPKGVLISYASLKNRLTWQIRYMGISRSDVFLFKAPITFDISLWEMLVPMLSHSKVVIAPQNKTSNMNFLLRAIERHGVTVVQFVPSLLNMFVENYRIKSTQPKIKLRSIVSSGENLTMRVAQQLFLSFEKIDLYNFYGPTETTICVLAEKVKQVYPTAKIPLGKAVDNCNIYLLDSNQSLIATDGVIGEIYITGICVGKGYTKPQPHSCSCYLPNTLDEYETIYKTGDLGLYEEGSLYFMGRNDRQIKLNGNLINLFEIESCLLKMGEVRNCLAKHIEADGFGTIFLYFETTSLDDAQSLIEKMKLEIREHLPLYMMPSKFVEVSNFSLTQNGKLSTEIPQ